MEKINWINGQAGGTPLSAENLNQMQDNIEKEITKQQEVLNKRTEGTVLFESVNGDNNSGIILNDTIANYKEVKVDYVVGVGNYKINESKRTPITDGNYICLNYITAHSETLQLFCTGRYLFSGATVTREYLIRSRLDATPQLGWDEAVTNIYITKITGYNI